MAAPRKKKRKVNWVAIGALGTLAAAVVGLLVWHDERSAPPDTVRFGDQINLSLAEPEPPDRQDHARAAAGSRTKSSTVTSARSPSGSASLPVTEAPSTNSGSPAQPLPTAVPPAGREINIGPVSSDSQNGGVTAGYVETVNQGSSR